MDIYFTGIIGSTRAMIEANRFKIAPHIAKVRSVLDAGDYAAAESSVNLPFDEALHGAVDDLAGRLRNSGLKYVFLIGIGGSDLGARAVFEAVAGRRDLAGQHWPQLISLAAPSASSLASAETIIEQLNSPDEFAVVSISKSGTTTETIMNTELLLARLQKRWPAVSSRLVVVSDMGSDYLEAAKRFGAHTFAMPPSVGGRYSVFSAVGLVPLALCGIDVRALARGAEAAANEAAHVDVSLNMAAQSAILAVDAYQSGRNIHDLFLFHEELESLGKWWRQLVGESIGKSTENIAPPRPIGITPTVSIGPADLHSVGQLYIGGPSDKLTTFVRAKSTADVSMPAGRIFPELVPMISKKSVRQVLDAIVNGTLAAFKAKDRPYVSIELADLSAYEIGYFMQYKMIETMYMARLMNVDPFDQPDVEAYKTVTRHLLEN